MRNINDACVYTLLQCEMSSFGRLSRPYIQQSNNYNTQSSVITNLVITRDLLTSRETAVGLMWNYRIRN